MARLRTLSQALETIKTMDSDTAITANALRRMVVTGHIPCIRVGAKYLIDVDTLFDDLKTTRPEDVLPGYKNPFRNP